MELDKVIESNSENNFNKWKSNKTRTVFGLDRPLCWCIKFNKPRMIHLLKTLLHKPVTEEVLQSIGIDNASEAVQLAMAESFPEAMKNSNNKLIKEYLLGTDKENILNLCLGYTSESTEKVKAIVPRFVSHQREMFINSCQTNYDTFIYLMKSTSNPPLRLFDDVCDKDIDPKVFNFLLETTGSCIDSSHVLKVFIQGDIERMKTFIEYQKDTERFDTTSEPMKQVLTLLVKDDSFIILLWVLERISLDNETRQTLIGECCRNSSYGCLRLLLKGKNSHVTLENIKQAIERDDLKMVEVIAEVNGIEDIFEAIDGLKDFPELQKQIHFENVAEVRTFDPLKLQKSSYSDIVKIAHIAKTKDKDYNLLKDNTLPENVTVKCDKVYEHLREYGELSVKNTMDHYLGLLKYCNRWFNTIDLERNLMESDNLSKTMKKDLVDLSELLDNVDI